MRIRFDEPARGSRALAAALGALAAAALPPVHAVPLLLVSFTGLVRLIHTSPSPWRAAAAAWWFGCAHFIAGLYWIGPALLTGPARFGWLAVPAAIGLAVVLAVYPALAAFTARLLPLTISGRVLALAIAWTAAEWLRCTILTGFPINLMGTVWAPSTAMIQGAALAGVYGLSFVTVLAAAAPAALAAPGAGARRAWLAPAAAFGLLAAVWAGGEIRLALAPDPPPTGTSLRLVSVNIDQRLKWRDDMRLAALTRYVELSRRPGFEATDLVIWPETTVTFYLAERAPLRARLSRAAPPDGHLVTGSLRRIRSKGLPSVFWNSLHALTPAGDIAATYDKHHLVPFAEYNPLSAVLPLPILVDGANDYSAGPGPRTLRLPGLPPFSPLICYEAIFPGAAVAAGGPAEERPRWLLNITNDAWFRRTSGIWQHFQAVRLRAVEEGLPMVRVANAGVSAVIDAYGRVRGRFGPDEAGVLDAPLPPALAVPPPQARLGGWTLAVLLLLATAALPALGLRR